MAGVEDSNPQHPDLESGALPIGAIPLVQIEELATLKNGGADGTRTRDPRRDRPVF